MSIPETVTDWRSIFWPKMTEAVECVVSSSAATVAMPGSASFRSRMRRMMPSPLR